MVRIVEESQRSYECLECHYYQHLLYNMGLVQGHSHTYIHKDLKVLSSSHAPAVRNTHLGNVLGHFTHILHTSVKALWCEVEVENTYGVCREFPARVSVDIFKVTGLG